MNCLLKVLYGEGIKEELKRAIENKIPNIIIDGELAKNVHKSKQI